MNNAIREYARALFEHAQAADQLGEYWMGLRAALRIVQEKPGIAGYFSGTKRKDEAWIDEIIEDDLSEVSEEVAQLFRKLCQNGLVHCMEGVAAEFRSMMDGARNISIVRVRSSVYLGYDKKQRLQRMLEEAEGRGMILECAVDPRQKCLLEVEMDGVLLDDEARGRLEEEMIRMAQARKEEEQE